MRAIRRGRSLSVAGLATPPLQSPAHTQTATADKIIQRNVPKPTTGPAGLWQLLLAASPEASSGLSSSASLAAAGTLPTAKNINVVALIRRKKIVTTTVTAATVPIDPSFIDRLTHIVSAVAVGPVQDRFLRWEIIRLEMCYDVLQHGCITDTSEGREVRIPLHMTTQHTTPDSLKLRGEAVNHPTVQSELFRLWGEISLRGGITLPSYYGICLAIVSTLLPHLSERECHQLITTEVELDLPDQTSDDAPMTKPQFLRWMGILALIWMETHSVAEALTFVQHVGALLLRPVETVDMDFYTRYSRKDPSLLVPLVPAKVCAGGAAAVVQYAREQLAISIKVRFGSLLSDAPVTAKARIKKRQRHTAGRSISAYMAPGTEEDNARTHFDWVEEAVESRQRSVAISGPPGAESGAQELHSSQLLHGHSNSFDAVSSKTSPTQSSPSAMYLTSTSTLIPTLGRNDGNDGDDRSAERTERKEEVSTRTNTYSHRFGLSSRALQRRRQATKAKLHQLSLTPNPTTCAPMSDAFLPPIAKVGARHLREGRQYAPTAEALVITTPPLHSDGGVQQPEERYLAPVRAPDASAAEVLRRLRKLAGGAGNLYTLADVDLRPTYSHATQVKLSRKTMSTM
jgi:hypothetical protein